MQCNLSGSSARRPSNQGKLGASGRAKAGAPQAATRLRVQQLQVKPQPRPMPIKPTHDEGLSTEITADRARRALLPVMVGHVPCMDKAKAAVLRDFGTDCFRRDVGQMIKAGVPAGETTGKIATVGRHSVQGSGG